MVNVARENNVPRIDAEVHLLPPEWCDASFMPLEEETVLRAKLYEHPERNLAVPKANEEGLLAEMERAGIDGAVLLGLPWVSVNANHRNNQYIAEIVERHPARFIGIGVTPAPSACDIVDEIKRIHDLGLEGVKVIPAWQGFHLDDELFEPALAEMESSGLVLMPHTDHAYLPNDGYDPPSALFEVARRHPELRILAPHLGGGLALNALHPSVSERLTNVLFVGTVPTTMKQIEWAVEAVGADRVAFGTDFPFNPSHDQESVVWQFEDLNISDEDRDNIWGANVLRFFGRSV